jgi:hypothetical protein
MTEPSDLVYREKRRGPRTEPWGIPVMIVTDKKLVLQMKKR